MLKLITAPTVEPVTLAEAKLQCRVDLDDDDALIVGLIVSAREWCEAHDWRAYLTQTYELWLPNWPIGTAIQLPRPPLASVTKVEYYDTADMKYTLGTSIWTTDTISIPGAVQLKYNQVWPSTVLREYNAICVTYVAGWDSPADMPQRIRQAILLLVGHWYENRENSTVGAVNRSIEFGVLSLLNIDRAMRF